MNIYLGPPTFFLAPQCSPTVFKFWNRHCLRTRQVGAHHMSHAYRTLDTPLVDTMLMFLFCSCNLKRWCELSGRQDPEGSTVSICICESTLNRFHWWMCLHLLYLPSWQRRIFIFGTLGYFELEALLEGMSYKLALHVLVTFTEKVVPIHKRITLIAMPSISQTETVTMTLTKRHRWSYMTTLPSHIYWVPHWPRVIWKIDSGVLFHTLGYM